MGNIHSDLKKLFSRSNATTNQARMAATVLTCNYGISVHIGYVQDSSGYAITFPHLEVSRKFPGFLYTLNIAK